VKVYLHARAWLPRAVGPYLRLPVGSGLKKEPFFFFHFAG